MKYADIPIKELLDRLKYNPDTGELFWEENPKMKKNWNTKYSGKKISCVGSHGYICFNFTYNGKQYHLLAHRVCFAIHNGFWPDLEIDHIDRDKTNNRASNLRTATSSQNKQNRGMDKNNKAGSKGVVYLGEKINGDARYAAFICNNGKTEYIGTYGSKKAASTAYRLRAKALFGEYAAE